MPFKRPDKPRTVKTIEKFIRNDLGSNQIRVFKVGKVLSVVWASQNALIEWQLEMRYDHPLYMYAWNHFENLKQQIVGGVTSNDHRGICPACGASGSLDKCGIIVGTQCHACCNQFLWNLIKYE